MHPIFRNFLSHSLDSGAAKFGILCTFNHDHRKTRDPIRSPRNKSVKARLVVGSVTTSESPVLYIFCLLLFLEPPSRNPQGGYTAESLSSPMDLGTHWTGKSLKRLYSPRLLHVDIVPPLHPLVSITPTPHTHNLQARLQLWQQIPMLPTPNGRAIMGHKRRACPPCIPLSLQGIQLIIEPRRNRGRWNP